jgi:NAD(P)-dependent dehydrogenase (short-subunit alcohol dehydrogenase family)
VEAFEAVIKVHLMGSFYVSHAAARIFREQESGSFVHFTSTSGLIGNFGQANYAAAKLGIVGLTRSIALDLQRFGVRANAIAPFAWTRITGTLEPAAGAVDERVERLKRLKPADCAPLAVVLASDAARDINGQVFAVRGSEVVLFSLPRPARAIRQSGGWTPEALAAAIDGSLREGFVPLEVTADVFSYEPPV